SKIHGLGGCMMAVTVLLALVFTALEPQALQTPDPNRIEEVRVAGNRRIPTDTIKYNLQTKPNDQFNPNVIRRDIKTLYALGHFDDIRVEEDQGKTGKIIIFRVTEKKLIRSVKYDGLKSVTNSEVLDKLREKNASISQESPYDPTKIRKAETIMKMMRAEKGHQDATVEATTEDIPPNRFIELCLLSGRHSPGAYRFRSRKKHSIATTSRSRSKPTTTRALEMSKLPGPSSSMKR